MAVGQIVYLHSLSSDAEQIAVHRVHLGTPQPPLHQRVKATHWRLRRPHPMAVPSIQPFYLVILSGADTARSVPLPSAHVRVPQPRFT